jgi:hypothetical protein
MEMFIQRVRKTKNNPEFLVGLGRWACNSSLNSST